MDLVVEVPGVARGRPDQEGDTRPTSPGRRPPSAAAPSAWCGRLRAPPCADPSTGPLLFVDLATELVQPRSTGLSAASVGGESWFYLLSQLVEALLDGIVLGVRGAESLGCSKSDRA